MVAMGTMEVAMDTGMRHGGGLQNTPAPAAIVQGIPSGLGPEMELSSMPF